MEEAAKPGIGRAEAHRLPGYRDMIRAVLLLVLLAWSNPAVRTARLLR
jgi:hypothetical protein